MGNIRQYLRNILQMVVLIVSIFILALVVDQITFLKDIDRYFHSHPEMAQTLQAITLVLTALGGILLVCAQFIPEPKQPPTDTRQGNATESPPLDFSEDRNGLARSITGSTSFSGLKEAWRQRAWRTSRPWRIVFLMATGTILLGFGLFGYFFLIGPPTVKIIVAGTLLYAIIRTVLALQMA